jgi:hypothetical protein
MFENPPGIKTSRKRRLLRRRGGVAEVTQVRRKANVEQRLSSVESYPPEKPVFRNVLRIYPSGMFQCEELCRAGQYQSLRKKKTPTRGDHQIGPHIHSGSAQSFCCSGPVRCRSCDIRQVWVCWESSDTLSQDAQVRCERDDYSPPRCSNASHGRGCDDVSVLLICGRRRKTGR